MIPDGKTYADAMLEILFELAPRFGMAVSDAARKHELAAEVKRITEDKHGALTLGTLAFIKIGQKRMTPEERAAVYQDGLTGMSNEEITDKHKIHRATLYRVMKGGGGRFSG